MKRLIVMALPFLPCLAFASLQVQVVDQAGLPAADCSVMVGMKAGEPFAGNVQKTDATGLAKFSVSGISDQPVTIAKSGYPRITYYNQSEETAVLRLPPASTSTKVELKGVFNNWPAVPEDEDIEWAKLGLFLKLLPAQSLFAFELTDMVSESSDSFSVYGKTFYVPSNVVIPRQRVHYGILPVTLEKSSYRLAVEVPGQYTFMGISGHFDFKKVVSILQDNKPIFDVLNELSLDGFGTFKKQWFSSRSTPPDISLDEGKLSPCVNLKVANPPQGFSMASFALARDAGRNGLAYLPTDIKLIDKPEGRDLSCITNDTRPITLVSVAMKYSGDSKGMKLDRGMSTVAARGIPRNGNMAHVTTRAFFDVPKLQVLSNGLALSVTRPENSNSPKAQALYAVLADVNHDSQVEVVHPQWVVFANGSQNQVPLPVLPAEMESISTLALIDQIEGHIEGVNFAGATQKRWEAIWMGQDPGQIYDLGFAQSSSLGYDLFETMTHASRNSVDF